MIHPATRRTIAGTIGVLALTSALTWHLWSRSADCPVDNPSIPLQAGDAKLRVEVAANDKARLCGLAYRDQLPADAGMLFVYTEAQPREFWMQHTRIPLALAFIDADHRITEILQLMPEMGERSVTSSQPVPFALETNPDWLVTNGVMVGDRVDFVLPGDLAID